MDKNRKVVAGIALKTNRPTSLSFKQLFNWTIWQFPRKQAGGLLGAVHPPLAEHGWYPAIIHIKDKQAQVHAHLDEIFASPEAAVEHINRISK